MKKINALFITFLIFFTPEVFAQFANGSYFKNTTSITCQLNDKTELVLGNEDHYSNQINRLDYFHFELTGYRKLCNDFSLGLGVRQTESYKIKRWNPGKTYFLYGVYFLNPGNIKIKFANRLALKTYKISDTQFGFDNITNVDFFARSTCKFPKPYLMDEIFSSMNLLNIQTIRLYGGFRLFRKEHLGLDIYYCYWKIRSRSAWENFNVLGLNTKIYI